MSAQGSEVVPILQSLYQQQEEEAKRTSQAFKHEIIVPSDDNKSKTLTNDSDPKEQQPRIQIDMTKLVSKKINIFLEKTENHNKVNIFTNKQSINLLNLTQQQTANNFNIFDRILTAKPLVKHTQSDEDASDHSQQSREALPTQQMKEPTEKIMKYQYQNTLKVLGTFKLAKFRAGTSTTKESVLLNLQQDESSKIKLLYFTIKSEGTLLSVYNGLLLKNTKIKQFMGKEQNLKLNVLKLKKGQSEGSMKGDCQQVKLQLSSTSDSIRLRTILDQFFKEK